MKQRLGWLFGVVALSCGLAALASATARAQPQKPVAPPNHRVVRVTGPEALRPVEVAVAINPTKPDHMIAVSLQAGKKGAPYTSNYAYTSTDGGRSWRTTPNPNPGKRVQGDDAITFTADGLALHTYIAFDGIRQARPKRAFSGIFCTTSRDGLRWSDPVPVIDHINSVTPHVDKPWPRADTTKESPHYGNIYVAYTRFDVYGSKDPEHKSHIYFARSLDHGKSFSVPHRISETPGDCVDSSNTVMGAVPAVGPKGEVYVVWAGPLGLVLAQSADGGWTFGKNKVISDTPGGWDYPVPGLGRCDGLPSVGVDLSPGPHRGTIHVAWTDRRFGDPDVFLISSRDGGATWSKPLRVNDDPKGNGKEQFFSWLAVDPVDGSVNVVFFDRRDTKGAFTGVTLARSVDGGKTFVNHRINQEPFDCNPRVFFGDYIGIDARAGRVVAVYQHFLEPRQLALSAAVFQFKPGSQEVQPEPKPGEAPKGEKPPSDNPPQAAAKVTVLPAALRETLKLDPWYQKYTDYNGLPILSSAKVSDAGLLEARDIVGHMLAKRDDVLRELVKKKARVVVMAPTELTTDVPEQRNMKPKDYWDKRARGLGGRLTSCGEENLLNLKGDRYAKENILVHEFAHAIHNFGLRAIDPQFDGKLRAAYARAMDKGLWKKTYAATNHSEYWAEGVQSYFDCNAPPGGVHNDINTREKLAKYDPELFQLIDEVFRQSPWRYVRFDRRHPGGLPPSRSPARARSGS